MTLIRYPPEFLKIMIITIMTIIRYPHEVLKIMIITIMTIIRYPPEALKIILTSVPVQTSDPQTSDGTNIRLTNVGQYKRRTSTNIGPVQTSDWYKRRTSTNVGRVHL